MDINEALNSISEHDLSVIQTAVLMQAVAALIQTHPNPQQVYQRFDFAYSNFQVGMSGGAVSPAGAVVARHLIESLFGTQ